MTNGFSQLAIASFVAIAASSPAFGQSLAKRIALIALPCGRGFCHSHPRLDTCPRVLATEPNETMTNRIAAKKRDLR